jgi:hypothetical protein
MKHWVQETRDLLNIIDEMSRVMVERDLRFAKATVDKGISVKIAVEMRR